MPAVRLVYSARATERAWVETACYKIRVRGRLRKELPGVSRMLA
jgi:hypothetical protein